MEVTLDVEDFVQIAPLVGIAVIVLAGGGAMLFVRQVVKPLFTRQQLLTAVFDRGEQEGTVDTYVHYIRRKTERSLIETVRGVGYRLGTPA